MFYTDKQILEYNKIIDDFKENPSISKKYSNEELWKMKYSFLIFHLFETILII